MAGFFDVTKEIVRPRGREDGRTDEPSPESLLRLRFLGETRLSCISFLLAGTFVTEMPGSGQSPANEPSKVLVACRQSACFVGQSAA